MSIPELRLFPQPQRQAEVIRHAPDTLDFTEAPNKLEKNTSQGSAELSAMGWGTR